MPYEYTLLDPIERPVLTTKSFQDYFKVEGRLSDRRILAVELIDHQNRPLVLSVENGALPAGTPLLAQAAMFTTVMALLEAHLNESGEFVLATGEEPTRQLSTYEALETSEGQNHTTVR